MELLREISLTKKVSTITRVAFGNNPDLVGLVSCIGELKAAMGALARFRVEVPSVPVVEQPLENVLLAKLQPGSHLDQLWVSLQIIIVIPVGTHSMN